MEQQGRWYLAGRPPGFQTKPVARDVGAQEFPLFCSVDPGNVVEARIAAREALPRIQAQHPKLVFFEFVWKEPFVP